MTYSVPDTLIICTPIIAVQEMFYYNLYCILKPPHGTGGNTMQYPDVIRTALEYIEQNLLKGKPLPRSDKFGKDHTMYGEKYGRGIR